MALTPKSAQKLDRPQEFSLNQIWKSPGSQESATGHKLVTSLGGAHSRHRAFKKPLLIPLFFHSRKAQSSRSESPQEIAEEAEVSNPMCNPGLGISHFSKSVLSPGRLQSLHRRTTKPCDFASVVHTDPGLSSPPDADPTVHRGPTTSETPYNSGETNWADLPQALFEAREFPFEESIRSGKMDSRLDASLDFGEKPCLAYCNVCNKETKTVVRQETRKCAEVKGLKDLLNSVTCCLTTSRRYAIVHSCAACDSILARF